MARSILILYGSFFLALILTHLCIRIYLNYKLQNLYTTK